MLHVEDSWSLAILPWIFIVWFHFISATWCGQVSMFALTSKMPQHNNFCVASIYILVIKICSKGLSDPAPLFFGIFETMPQASRCLYLPFLHVFPFHLWYLMTYLCTSNGSASRGDNDSLSCSSDVPRTGISLSCDKLVNGSDGGRANFTHCDTICFEILVHKWWCMLLAATIKDEKEKIFMRLSCSLRDLIT